MSSQDCGDSSVWIQDCIAEITVAGQNCMVETALYSRDKSVQSQGCIASQNCTAETPLSRTGAESLHDYDLQIVCAICSNVDKTAGTF